MIHAGNQVAPGEAAPTRHVASTAFGDLDIPEAAIMHFAEPLWGFPDRTEYALLPGARAGLWWLQSVTNAATVFILADPFVVDAAYDIDLSDADRSKLALTKPDQAMGLVMLSLPAAPEGAVTANFRAPIVFNVEHKVGAQVVSRDESHDLRQPVDLTKYPLQDGGMSID